VANYCISDHFPVLFTRTLKTKQVKGCHEHIKYRSFKHFNEEKIREDLLNSIGQTEEPEKGLCMFFDILNKILNKHASVKEERVKYDKQPEWLHVTNEIKKSMFKRDELHKKKMFNDYKIQRNKTVSMIRKSKKNFYNRSILENKMPKFLWKNLKCISNADSNTANDIVIPHCIGNSD